MNTAEEFLEVKHLFQLGDLPTETPHPKTSRLAELAKNDVDSALALLREVDLEALRKILGLEDELRPIFETVFDTLQRGQRVFLVGCGATGRLSLSLEYLWRRKHPKSEQVCSLMAGGDVALVHSLEGFEDFPEYGARHLQQLGFDAGDLLIGTSEGGETSYVIGAVEWAARSSRRKPLFLFCNPRQVLIDKVERSRRALTNPEILSLCLDTGPMALTGSTRMQASTALMLVVGLALDYGKDSETAFRDLRAWIGFLESSNNGPLKNFVCRESETYLEGNYTCYSSNDFAITVFTDTTERAPTFNLAPFDNPKHPTRHHSLTYMSIPGTRDAEAAWSYLLAHTPRPLSWPEVHAKTSADYLYSFDFSSDALAFRQRLIPARDHHVFEIDSRGHELMIRFRGVEHCFALPGGCELFNHLTLKMLLNMHSTLVMGRLARFEGNLMTWVYPSNGKLIDRAARYSRMLLEQRGLAEFCYDDIVRAQFAAKTELSPTESIVHKTIERLLSGRAPAA